MEPYATLVALAQEELDLVQAGRFDELEELAHRRASTMAAVPDIPPASAAPLLRRARDVQQQVSDALAVARAGALNAMDRLAAGRTTVEGYRMSTGAQAPSAQADYRG